MSRLLFTIAIDKPRFNISTKSTRGCLNNNLLEIIEHASGMYRAIFCKFGPNASRLFDVARLDRILISDFNQFGMWTTIMRISILYECDAERQVVELITEFLFYYYLLLIQLMENSI